MRIKESFGEKVFMTFIYAFLIFLIIITLYPLVHVVLASLSDSDKIIAHSGLLYKPLGFNWESYKTVLNNSAIISGYLNTSFIVVFGLLVSISVTALGAFVLSRKNVLWNRYFIFLIVFTLFFQGGLIPFYLVVKGVGLIDSLWATIIPFAVNTFNLIIMRTSFQSVPEALEESAKMDGANHLVILFRIILPLSMPVLAVMTLYYAVDKWNGWFYASIFLKDRDLFPLQLILREILISNSTDGLTSGSTTGDNYQIGESIKYATIMVATLPILFIYPFLQKYFVKGALIGALKG